MTKAFASSITGGKQFEDVLKTLTLKLSDMAVKLAFKPLEKSIASGLSGLLSGSLGRRAAEAAAIRPMRLARSNRSRPAA